MIRPRREVWPLAIAAMLASCAQAAPQAPVGSAPSQAPGAPKPIQPLLPAPSSGWQAPSAPLRTPPAHLAVQATAIGGDPTVLVYPSKALTPGTRYPAMIFLHGHGMDPAQLTERTGLAEAAAAEGWLAASGAFGGRAHWANAQALRQVGTLVAELVAKHQADPDRLYFVGFSMGGGTALLAAANPLGLPYKAAAVVSSQGFADLAAMTWSEASGGAYAEAIAGAYGGSLEPQEAEAHSPLTHVRALASVPVYLEHGESDTAVRPAHSRRMADALAEAGAPPALRMYPGRGHSEDTIDTEAIIAFLRGKVAR